MDHLRHRSNLVNPACLLSFSKYSLSKAGYQAPAGCGENKTEKSPSWEFSVQHRPSSKKRDWEMHL